MRAVKLIAVFQHFQTLDNCEENLKSADIPLAKFSGNQAEEPALPKIESSPQPSPPKFKSGYMSVSEDKEESKEEVKAPPKVIDQDPAYFKSFECDIKDNYAATGNATGELSLNFRSNSSDVLSFSLDDTL